MDRPNANMVTSSFDRTQGSFAQPVYQPYNNFRIQNLGGNIIQGQLNKLSVTEIMFPYDCPTIKNGFNNGFYIGLRDVALNGDVGGIIDVYLFQVAERFWGGQELVTELNGLTSINTASGSANVPMNTLINWNWDDQAQTITMLPVVDWSPVNGTYMLEFLPLGLSGLAPVAPDAIVRNPYNFPNFFWTAGFRNNFATNPAVIWPVPIEEPQPIEFNLVGQNIPDDVTLPPNSYSQIVGTYYTGRYTDYIDIVSSTLCQAQYIRDTTTSQNTTRRDVIARIYVCNNISVVSLTQEGSRPFIIHRMFPVPKVMKWTADRSIDAIDLQLFDMYGQPLPNGQDNTAVGTNGKQSYAGQADYAITFHVHEPRADAQEENVGYSFQS